MLANKLQENVIKELETLSQFPAPLRYRFDRPFNSSESQQQALTVQKTSKRTIVSINFSTFQAKEVVREERKKDAISTHHSPELEAIAPRGARYAYDLIAFVGIRSFLEGRKLTEIQKELLNQRPFCHVPLSSLYDAQHKFLFYLGELHQQASAQLKAYLRERDNITWLIDGTLEPGTPLFFGVKEAEDNILLGSWKIPTENDEDISRCLSEAVERYGEPNQILHDLSARMHRACKIALPHVHHYVCHYHFARDVGEDLYTDPQQLLCKRLRAMKLKLRMKDQRSAQTQRLKKIIEETANPLVLNTLLSGEQINTVCTDALGREVLLALHSWMLDYPRDGHRQGFPFDPYLLYFHRRAVKVHDALTVLFSCDLVGKRAPKVLFNFFNRLNNYLNDPIIVKVTDLYEKACNIFGRIRKALLLSPKGSNPMHEPYDLRSEQQDNVKESLCELRNEFEKEKDNCADPKEEHYYEIAITHLDKYMPYLLPSSQNKASDDRLVRTTNALETHWSKGKRIRRQSHGRRKLTRDFQALPEEFMLVPNLQNPRYVALVLGSLEQLAKKLAEAGKNTSPFSHWRKRRHPLSIGRLPVRLLKEENFVDDLIQVYDAQCQF
jgi:hypothetical protein